jgi:selenoprotein W-related protein
MAEILKEHEPEIESFVLVPSDGGAFEFTVNGNLLYSKKQSARHANPGEVAALMRTYVEENKV